MSLAAGTTLGAYEVISLLGAGGMGQVYRARDAKLNRDVALKVLPDAVAGDAERLARFTREAQTLASLNHANIAAIFGLEESSGVRALVMELVEGDDLSALIARHGHVTHKAESTLEAEGLECRARALEGALETGQPVPLWIPVLQQRDRRHLESEI